MTITLERMQSHVMSLITENDIQCSWEDGKAFVNREAASVIIPPIRSDLSYSTALHEIGHIKGEFQDVEGDVMTREIFAWKWAIENALTWTPTMELNRRASLATHKYAISLNKLVMFFEENEGDNLALKLEEEVKYFGWKSAGPMLAKISPAYQRKVALGIHFEAAHLRASTILRRLEMLEENL